MAGVEIILQTNGCLIMGQPFALKPDHVPAAFLATYLSQNPALS